MMLNPDQNPKTIFNLPEPQSYKCTVWHYSVSHSKLYIRIHNADDAQYLFFQEVWFFEGATRWTGASFSLGSVDERETLWKIILPEMTSDPRRLQYLLENYHLFVVETTQPIVRILSATGSLIQDLPKILTTTVL